MTEDLDPRVSPDGSPEIAEALWAAKARLRAIEEAAPAGIIGLDLNGHVIIWNRAAERLFGWRADEVCGRRYTLVPDDKKAEERALVARVMGGEVVSNVETYRLRKDGSPIEISLSCGPIIDGAGNVSGTMRVLTDITEAKRLARQILQDQKVEAFGQLAGGIAHDFNNLLTVINGFSALVHERVEHLPEVAADVREISKAGERASELTGQLLAFCRKQKHVLRVLDLGEVVSRFERMLSRVVRENIRLELFVAPEIGHTRADPGQIEQVVMNLVVNAGDAMPQGGTLTIAVVNVVLDPTPGRQHGGGEGGRYASLSVTDNGSGMTPEVLSRAVEPFFTTKPPGKGTGLGLSTAARLVEQSGGYVTVESTAGVGTTVTTYWPIVTDAITDAAKIPSPPHLQGTETILLVEDEIGVRQLMKRVLERHGYVVLAARDADDAMAIAQGYAKPIHLLVSDLILPGRGGPDLAQQIVKDRPAIRLLLVSGHPSRQSVGRGMSEHASFLQKPFDADILAKAVRERLDYGVG